MATQGTLVKDLIPNNLWNIVRGHRIDNQARVDRGDETFKMIPKMKGGTLKLVMGNIHGMPNNENNIHKLKSME